MSLTESISGAWIFTQQGLLGVGLYAGHVDGSARDTLFLLMILVFKIY